MIFKALLSLTIAGAGVYVLTHVTKLARIIQNLYIRQAEDVQKKKGMATYLFIYNPATWKTPYTTFIFKAGVVFVGLLLLLIAYPVVFGPIRT